MEDAIDSEAGLDRQRRRQRLLSALADARAVRGRQRVLGAKVRVLIALRRPVTD
jgi:hypothetical protein